MSYLRGPLSRDQIRQWKEGQREVLSAKVVVAPDGAEAGAVRQRPWPVWLRLRHNRLRAVAVGRSASPAAGAAFRHQAVLPAGAGVAGMGGPGCRAGRRAIIYRDKQLVYRPALIGRAAVRVDNETYGVHEQRAVARVLPVPEKRAVCVVERSAALTQVGELDDQPATGRALCAAAVTPGRRAPDQGDGARTMRTMSTARRLSPCRANRTLKLTARPDESLSQFKRRCYQVIEEGRDAEIRALERR